MFSIMVMQELKPKRVKKGGKTMDEKNIYDSG